jgi:hypothetical protein
MTLSQEIWMGRRKINSNLKLKKIKYPRLLPLNRKIILYFTSASMSKNTELTMIKTNLLATEDKL